MEALCGILDNHIFIATINNYLLARVFGELVIYMCTWHQYLPLFMFKELSNSGTWRGGGGGGFSPLDSTVMNVMFYHAS